MKLRFISVIAIMAVTVGLFASCSQSSEEPSDSKSSAGSSAVSDSSSDKAPASDTGDGGIVVSAPGELPITQEKVTLDVFIKHEESTLTDLKTNSFTLALEELTNVHLDMTIVASDAYSERLTLVLASGDYPGVIMSGLPAGFNNDRSNADMIKYGSNEKILIPLNDLIEEHGFHIKERWAEMPNIKEYMTMLDGNIYGIPFVNNGGKGHTVASMKAWINQSWLDTLGLHMPETTDDFYDTMVAFKAKDPNGNGLADEIPITGAIGTWNGDIYINLLNAFGYFDNNRFVKLENDTFISAITQDYIKDGLAYLAKLYSEGLIDPAALTQNEQQMSALGNNQDAVIVGLATCGHLGMFVSVNDVERASMYTTMPPLKGPSGYRGIPFATEPTPEGAQFVITDKCEYPEVAIKLADLFCSEEIWLLNSGIQGVHWDYADPGATGLDGVTPAKYKYLQVTTSGEGAIDNDKWGQTTSLIRNDFRNVWQFEGDIYDPVNYEARLVRETEKLRPYAAPVQTIPPLLMSEDISTRQNQLRTQIADYLSASLVEFITGRKNIDADWDAYVQGIENLGLAEYIENMQNAYDAIKGK